MSDKQVVKDPNAPASKRQLWALFCAYKKDYRDVKITYGEASALLEAAAANRTPKLVKSDFKEYFLSDANVTKMAERMTHEMGIKSVLKNDTTLLPDDGKRYLFLGGGCGFSHIEWDRRNKIGEEIMSEFGRLRPEFEQRLLKKFDPDYLRQMSQSGNPIQAHLLQNLSYNTALNYIVAKFMEDKGIKKVRVSSRYD